MERKLFFTLVVLGLLVLLGQLLFEVFRPFLMALLWASVLVTVTYPIYQRILAYIPQRKELAAILMCLGLTLILVLPLSLLGIVLAHDAQQGAKALTVTMQKTDFEAMLKPDGPLFQNPWALKIQSFVTQYVDFEQINLRQIILNTGQKISQLMLDSSKGFFGAFASTLILLGLVELSMFFLFCDGQTFIHYLRRLIPVAPSDQDLVLARARDVIQATIYGSVGTAVAQGFVGGIILLILGVPSAILWAVVMTLSSFLPMIGTSLVWVPVAIWLLVTGSPIKAMIMVACGILVIGTVDNIVRPLLIRSVSSEGSQLNTLVLFFAVLGGLNIFGLLGIVISPLLVVLFLTLLELVGLSLSDKKGEHNAVSTLESPPTNA